MAKRPAPKKKPDLSRNDLASQIDDFINQGGEITQVPTGTSGIDKLQGTKQIRISNK